MPPKTATHVSLLLAIVAATASTAEGMVPVKFCFRLETRYVDSGVGEDFWTNSTPTQRAARGIYARVESQGAGWRVRWAGYTGDGRGSNDPGLGCTDTLWVPGAATHSFTLWSLSRVQGNYVRAYGGPSNGYAVATRSLFLPAGSSGSFTIDVDSSAMSNSKVFNTSMAASYALYRHAGGMSNETYTIFVHTGGTFYDHPILYVGDQSGYRQKFKIVHEMGHAIGVRATGGGWGSDYTRYHTRCPASDESAAPAHSMTSYEYSAAAMKEGFAHFYAADVWNSDQERDCWFGYYKNELGEPATVPISCESPSTADTNADGVSASFPARYFETVCQSTRSGRGVELDWLRAFWDLHTDGAANPSFTEILNWIVSAFPWDDENAYQQLDAAAAGWGGVLLDRWNTAKTRNGIDH